MTEGLWAAIIGVGGTILGTVLGFVLGKIDFGKLKIRIKKGEEKTYYACEYGESVEKLYSVDCSFVISLYNDSNTNKVFRDAKILFLDENNEEILLLPLEDSKTARSTSSTYHVDNIAIENIQPKTGADIRTKFSTYEIGKIYKAKKAVLLYTNEAFKVQRKFLWRCDYSKIELTKPRKHTLEY